MNARSNNIVLTSRDQAEGPIKVPPLMPDLMRPPGDLVLCEEMPCDARDIMNYAMKVGTPLDAIGTDRKSWHSYRVTFAGGVEDRISVLMPDAGRAVTPHGLLAAIWPVLREDCLQDLHSHASELCDKAMLWMIASEINMAVLVMNKDGLMLRANAAAKRLLEQETVLRRTPKGIRCVNDAQTQQFRSGLASCARSDPQAGERIVFLDVGDLGLRIPVTLSRFCHQGIATDLVLVAMPLPPDSRRVEMLARAVGLTPTEARIAALLQMGLSNRDAAIAAGLKEQSVSTYAKRVLNKLNVTSRAEMAQMLTWQAAGGRLS